MAGRPEARVRWLADIGLLTPDADDTFSIGDVLASKMVSAPRERPAETLEQAVTDGFLSFQRTDEYLLHEPELRRRGRSRSSRRTPARAPSTCPRSTRSSAEARPGPADPRRRGSAVRALPRGLAAGPRRGRAAARLLAQAARAAMLGWTDLMDEQVAGPVRQQLYRGELEEFPDEVRVSFMRVTNLVPEMFTWLSARYLEQRSVNGSSRASSGSSRPAVSRHRPHRRRRPRSCSWTSPGYTTLTRERGDESAVRSAAPGGGRGGDPSRGSAREAAR